MNTSQKLILLKTLHTIIWVFFNVVIFYFVYAAFTGRIDRWLWICLGLIVLEGLILLVFRRMCPITVIARRYSDSSRDNFDIYLPNWLARYNKLIYTCVVGVGLIMLVLRLLAR